jgi:hypothetical protein
VHRTGTAFRGQQGRFWGAAALILLAVPAAAQQDARARAFMLMNGGSAAVTAVELSPSGESRYGPSMIGRVELPPGNALHLTPPSGSPCLNDLRIRWADGRVEERLREDLCHPQRMIRLTSP